MRRLSVRGRRSSTPRALLTYSLFDLRNAFYGRSCRRCVEYRRRGGRGVVTRRSVSPLPRQSGFKDWRESLGSRVANPEFRSLRFACGRERSRRAASTSGVDSVKSQSPSVLASASQGSGSAAFSLCGVCFWTLYLSARMQVLRRRLPRALEAPVRRRGSFLSSTEPLAEEASQAEDKKGPSLRHERRRDAEGSWVVLGEGSRG